jgi:AGCS family alanine or glycine:cation symporter
MQLFQFVYNFLWGDLVKIPLPGGSSLGLSLLVILLIPAGIYCTVITGFLPIRLFPEMIRVSTEKNVDKDKKGGVSGIEALIVSTATRVGMGNLVGVVAAVSAGGAGAIFWMWLAAIIGSATAFVEATLAQIYKEKDPLYGGYRGGPAYYIHHMLAGKKKKSVVAVLFALSALLCWCGISQVVGNSVSSALDNAFHVPPLATAVILCIPGAFIVLRKNVTVKVLNIIVPIIRFNIKY